MVGFPGGAAVKNLLANAGDARDAGLMPGWGRSLEEEMATHSSILAWRVPRTEAGRLQSVGSAESNLAEHTAVSSNARQAHPGPAWQPAPGRWGLTREVWRAHTHVVVDPVHTGGVVLAVVVLAVVWVDLTPLPLEAQRAGAALGMRGWGQGSGSGRGEGGGGKHSQSGFSSGWQSEAVLGAHKAWRSEQEDL